LADLPVVIPGQHPDADSAWHLYVVKLRLEKIQASHRGVFEHLRAEGIGVNIHYIPVHQQPYYASRFDFGAGYCPEAEAYYSRAITLPLYPGLEPADQDFVVETLRSVTLRGSGFEL
jgi:dTDP-4-amino-4,6-dideoxygalactose transaminase